MKVGSFLTLFNVRLKNVKDISEDYIVQTIKDLIKPVGFISYDDKIQLIDNVLRKTSDTKYPTAYRHREFMMSLISTYTSLEVDKAGYDALCEAKLLDFILQTFKSECDFITALLNMCLQDESRC